MVYTGNNTCACQKCQILLSYNERIRISHYEYVKDPKVSGSIGKTIDGYNLCVDCYKDYIKLVRGFFRTQVTRK